MRYRALDADRDSSFGSGYTKFLIDNPPAVAQAVMTRLLLMTGEWFLDTNEGTPYSTQIIGTGTQRLYDLAIQDRILGTPNVKEIVSYSSQQNPTTRKLTVSATINTAFGQTPFSVQL